VLELAVAGGDAPTLLGQLGAGGWTAYRRD
jgi:hypothetical protein